MSLVEKILSQEEYDKTDLAPAKDMNLGSHFLCVSCTYCRCCPLVSNSFFIRNLSVNDLTANVVQVLVNGRGIV